MVAIGLLFLASGLFLNLLFTQFPGRPSRHRVLWFVGMACWAVYLLACLLVAIKAFGIIAVLVGVPTCIALLIGLEAARRAIESRHDAHEHNRANHIPHAEAKP